MTSLACTFETQRILKCTCKLILRGVAAQVAKSNWISSTLSVVKINGFVNAHFIRSGCAGLAGRSCGWLSTHSCTPLRDERTAQIVTTINAVPFNQFSRFVCILSRRRGYLLISLKSAYWYSFFSQYGLHESSHGRHISREEFNF